YELNGGAWASGYTAPVQKQYDESLRLPLSGNLSNDGYLFLGWYTNAACTGTAVTELPAESGSVTVYARWYDLSGRNSGLSQTITHDFSTQ
ncbi:MAG: InlB B-repeat-containing protein, partial [Lachnospiraceae bacterium]|nr:InlB B-repeat-containing protein [Lachnospiraceae bacterium]